MDQKSRRASWPGFEHARHRPAALALLLAGLAIGSAAHGQEVAPDVVVFTEATMVHAIGDVGQMWRSQTGVPVRVFASPTKLLLEEIAHGVRSDVLIGQGEQEFADALARKLVQPQPVLDAWRDRLVLARRGPAAPSDLATALAAAPRLAVVDAAVAASGQQSHAALAAAGTPLPGRVTGVVDTADAVFLLRSDAADAALVYTSDLAAEPGLAAAASVPDALYTAAVFKIAVSRVARSPNTDRFIAFLGSPQAAEVMREDGLEVLP